MAQFIVRNLEDEVKTALKQRAGRHGRSMEEEVRQILRDAVKPQRRSPLGSRIAVRFKGLGLTEDLPEWSGQPAKPADFES